MEGILLVPPDRGTLIGRALWKPRVVVMGSAQREHPQQSNVAMSQSTTASRMQAGRASTRGQSNGKSEVMYLSIYKGKSDWEPIQQHAISSITDCQIQMVAHRKQGHVLPTLVISVSPDPATDKLRKRRSSRTAGLTSTKDSTATTLWFRTGDDQYTLQDWARQIQSLMQPNMATPMSPITPASPTFINPFSPRTREPSDYFPRPGSGNPNSRSTLSHKASNQTHSSRERDRPLTYSESPSLRSRRSDLSHASSMNPGHMGFGAPGHGFTMTHPADLPSPASTIGEYQGEFIEGWTSAQGRSSTLSSPIRGRDSISSQPPVPPQQPVIDSSSPPGPRETILDRAFQLRCIPGSDREVPGEEKLSSLARFDALMREVDEKRVKPAAETRPQNDGMKSAWDLDDDSDDDNDEPGPADEDDEANEHDMEDSVFIPPTAQRALHFIASRHEPPQASRAQNIRSLVNHNPETLKILNSGYSHLRPHTGYSRNRPAIAQRTHSQPQLAANATMSATLDVPSSSSASGKTCEDGGPSHRNTEKRQSTSSMKRLSFTEFTKRLSSTSSLLLVQTNASGSSSRGSSEIEVQQNTLTLKGNLNPRGAPPPSADRDGDKRCGWRGSVGVFGSEGGFL